MPATSPTGPRPPAMGPPLHLLAAHPAPSRSEYPAAHAYLRPPILPGPPQAPPAGAARQVANSDKRLAARLTPVGQRPSITPPRGDFSTQPPPTYISSHTLLSSVPPTKRTSLLRENTYFVGKAKQLSLREIRLAPASVLEFVRAYRMALMLTKCHTRGIIFVRTRKYSDKYFVPPKRSSPARERSPAAAPSSSRRLMTASKRMPRPKASPPGAASEYLSLQAERPRFIYK